jgi:hypothetical protein
MFGKIFGRPGAFPRVEIFSGTMHSRDVGLEEGARSSGRFRVAHDAAVIQHQAIRGVESA